MAFTKTPEQSTYKTQRFPVVGAPQQRTGQYSSYIKDQRFMNCYPEVIKEETLKAAAFFLRKRPGMSTAFSIDAGEGRGIIFDPTTQFIFGVTGNKLWRWNNSVVDIIAVLATSTGSVGFTTHLTTSQSIILLDGINGYVIIPSTGAVTQITDVDFPTPHIPDPVSMDGYVFVAKATTADIYNSDLDDPFSWTPGNFITAEMYPDNIVALSKNNNYLYAVGTNSIEFFFDAGVATGSPLQRNDSAVLQFGTPAPGSVTQTEKEVVVIGSTDNGGRTVWLIDGFKAEEIALEPVKLALDAEDSSIAFATCYCIRTSGHKFYVLSLKNSNRTFVYDFDEKLWHEWDGTNDANTARGLFRGVYASDSQHGNPYLQDINNGKVYSLREDVYQDDTRDIVMQFTTQKIDFDSMNRKDFYRFSIFGDWPTNVDTANIVLDWTDDDYRTFQGNRTIKYTAGKDSAGFVTVW